jgi:hypothetical protein
MLRKKTIKTNQPNVAQPVSISQTTGKLTSQSNQPLPVSLALQSKVGTNRLAEREKKKSGANVVHVKGLSWCKY